VVENQEIDTMWLKLTKIDADGDQCEIWINIALVKSMQQRTFKDMIFTDISDVCWVTQTPDEIIGLYYATKA
jgi:hypothetical protein